MKKLIAATLGLFLLAGMLIVSSVFADRAVASGEMNQNSNSSTTMMTTTKPPVKVVKKKRHKRKHRRHHRRPTPPKNANTE